MCEFQDKFLQGLSARNSMNANCANSPYYDSL